MSKKPQPTKNASDIYEMSAAIATSLVPPLAVLKVGADILIKKRMQEGQVLLFREIEQVGLDALSKNEWDYFVPAAYRFFEQVRLGEYRHNLRVVAKIIAGDLNERDRQLDIGKISRAAVKLEMLPKDHLIALSRCDRAFQIYENSEEYDGYWKNISEQELIQSFAEIRIDVKPIQCQVWLHELASRGILTSGSRAGRIGGIGYYKNSIFDEVIGSATAIQT